MADSAARKWANRRRRITVLLFILSISIWTSVGAEALANAMSAPGYNASVRPEAVGQRPEPRPLLPVVAQVSETPQQTAPVLGRTAQTGNSTPAAKPAVSSAALVSAPTTTATATRPVELTLVTETKFRNSGDDIVASGTASVPLRAIPQARDIVLLRELITPPPTSISTDPAGNRVAEFDLSGIAPGQALTVTQAYTIRVWGYGGSGADGTVLASYRSPEPKIESSDPRIVDLAQALVAGCTGVEEKLAAIFAGTRQQLKYSLTSPARNRGALAALNAGSGVCEEFASLFVALARASGIPSRLVIGYGRNASSADKAWSAVTSLSKYKHAWAEAYVPGYGWAAFDPTLNKASLPGIGAAQLPSGMLIPETYRNRGLTTVYSGGRIDANWRVTVSF